MTRHWLSALRLTCLMAVAMTAASVHAQMMPSPDAIEKARDALRNDPTFQQTINGWQNGIIRQSDTQSWKWEDINGGPIIWESDPNEATEEEFYDSLGVPRPNPNWSRIVGYNEDQAVGGGQQGGQGGGGLDSGNWGQAISDMASKSEDLDRRANAAYDLLKSANPADQLRGQQQLQQVQQETEALMQTVKVKGDNARDAISGSGGNATDWNASMDAMAARSADLDRRSDAAYALLRSPNPADQRLGQQQLQQIQQETGALMQSIKAQGDAARDTVSDMRFVDGETPPADPASTGIGGVLEGLRQVLDGLPDQTADLQRAADAAANLLKSHDPADQLRGDDQLQDVEDRIHDMLDTIRAGSETAANADPGLAARLSELSSVIDGLSAEETRLQEMGDAAADLLRSSNPADHLRGEQMLDDVQYETRELFDDANAESSEAGDLVDDRLSIVEGEPRPQSQTSDLEVLLADAAAWRFDVMQDAADSGVSADNFASIELLPIYVNYDINSAPGFAMRSLDLLPHMPSEVMQSLDLHPAGSPTEVMNSLDLHPAGSPTEVMTSLDLYAPGPSEVMTSLDLYPAEASSAGDSLSSMGDSPSDILNPGNDDFPPVLCGR